MDDLFDAEMYKNNYYQCCALFFQSYSNKNLENLKKFIQGHKDSESFKSLVSEIVKKYKMAELWMEKVVNENWEFFPYQWFYTCVSGMEDNFGKKLLATILKLNPKPVRIEELPFAFLNIYEPMYKFMIEGYNIKKQHGGDRKKGKFISEEEE